MLLASVFAWPLFIIGLLLSFQGLWLTSRALWPARVQAAAGRCRRNGVASFFVGLPIVAIAIVFSVAVGRAGGAPGQILAFFVAGLWFVYANVGIAGLATHIGQRLASPADADRPWRATLRGGIALELAWLTPVPGWVALLPISIILGTGAATLSFFRPRIDTQNPSGHGAYVPNMPYTAPYAPPYVPDPYASGAYEPSSHGRAAVARPPEPIEVGR